MGIREWEQNRNRSLQDFVSPDVGPVPWQTALIQGDIRLHASIDRWAPGQQRVGKRGTAIVRQRTDQRILAVDVAVGGSYRPTNPRILDKVVITGGEIAEDVGTWRRIFGKMSNDCRKETRRIIR